MNHHSVRFKKLFTFFTGVLVGLLGLALTVSPALADCRTDALLALNRAVTACQDLNGEAICHGGGTVEAIFYGEAPVFALVGDRADARQIETLRLDATAAMSAVRFAYQPDLDGEDSGRRVFAFAYGTLTLTNAIPPNPVARLVTTGQANIRTEPDDAADILAAQPLNTALLAHGVDASGRWFRVYLDDAGDQVGWVSERVTNRLDPDVLLPELVSTDELRRAYDVFTLDTSAPASDRDAGSDGAACEGLPSGLLLQTPNAAANALSFMVNGTPITLRGTAFIEAPDGPSTLRVTVLDGLATVNSLDVTKFVPAGSLTAIDARQGAVDLLDAAPYDFAAIAGLPISGLDYRIRLAPPPAQTAIDAAIAAAQVTPTPRPSRETLVQQTQCIRTVTRQTTVWAGPATTYEVVTTLPVDARIFPVLRLVVSDGTTWWQLNTSGWILASQTASTPPCGEIPVTDGVPPPRANTYELETCLSTNGPIRPGQDVRLEFRDGGWANSTDAIRAISIDPGRFIIGTRTVSASATDPYQAAPASWYRTFYAYWRAEPGTYRIVGRRLTYVVTCDLTVPVE